MSANQDPAWERQLAAWRDWLDGQNEQPELNDACQRIGNTLLGGAR